MLERNDQWSLVQERGDLLPFCGHLHGCKWWGGIGDFQGRVRRLDYLQGLGVTAIWLMPCPAFARRDKSQVDKWSEMNELEAVCRLAEVDRQPASNRRNYTAIRC